MSDAREAAIRAWWANLSDDGRAKFAGLPAGAVLSLDDVKDLTNAGILVGGAGWVEQHDLEFFMPADLAEFIVSQRP